MRTRETSSIALLDNHRPRPAADRRLGRRSTTSPNQLNDSGEASCWWAQLSEPWAGTRLVTRSVHIASDSIAWRDGTTRKVRAEMRHC